MGRLITRVGRASCRQLTRVRVFVLTVLGSLLVLVLVTAPALAQEKVPDFEITTEEAPKLDYSVSWGTGILTFGLLIFFFFLLFWQSEKEFKGVVNERFGPKQ